METQSFEDAFTQLEAAVTALQDGHLPLEQALSYYEQGVKLAQYCQELLQHAELRVQQLRIGEAGEPETMPFE